MQELYTFSLNHWELVAAFLITLTMLIFNLFGDRLRGYESITAEAAVRVLNGDNTLMIDVRSKDELSKDGHIKDARHIPAQPAQGEDRRSGAAPQRPGCCHLPLWLTLRGSLLTTQEEWF